MVARNYCYVLLLMMAMTDFIVSQEQIDIENFIDGADEEQIENNILNLVDYYRHRKIDLSRCNFRELSNLPLISVIESYNYLKLFRKYPTLLRTDIADSLKMSESQKYILLECTKVSEDNNLKMDLRSRVFSEIDSANIANNKKYIGNSFDIYNRLFISTVGLSLGILNRKNIGEELNNGFTGGNIQYKNANYRILLGDFIAKFGAGGLLWSQLSQRKGADVISQVTKIGNGIFANSSSSESGYFRGIAVEGDVPITANSLINLSLFYSRNNKAANIDTLGRVSSIYVISYFRDEREIAKMNQLEEVAAGGNLEYSNEIIKLGSNFLYLNYNREIISQSAASFTGQKGLLHSYYFNIDLYNFTMLNELSFDSERNMMIKVGLENIVKNIHYAVLYRNIASHFRSPYGYAFGEFSNPNNEEGIYFGAKVDLSNTLKVSLYADIYQSKGSTYEVPGKVNGFDLFSELDLQLNKKNNINIRIKSENKTDIVAFENRHNLLGQKELIKTRLISTSKLINNVILKLRADGCFVKYSNFKKSELGAAFSIELKYNVTESYNFALNFCTFNTDSYESAIWHYENLAQGYLRNVALFGSGAILNSYFNLKVFEFCNINISYSLQIRRLPNEYPNSSLDSRLLSQIDIKI